MIPIYPHSSAPIILTDDIYSRYGGLVDSTHPDVRTAAYIMAEEAVYQDFETPLRLTIFTGTYAGNSYRFLLDHAYVTRVILTQFVDYKGDIQHTVSGTSNWEVNLEDAVYGLVTVAPNCYARCLPQLGYPWKVNVVYEAGLSSGTSYDPRILLGLTKYAGIALNEMIGYGNEGVGDVGIQTFTNQEYKEERMTLLRTAYGDSAQANFIHRLLSPYRIRRHPGW
jgi:hypothetical protein